MILPSAFFRFLLFSFLLFCSIRSDAQCNNTSRYPYSSVLAPAIGVSQQIATCNYLGEYAEISNMAAAADYQVTSTGAGDYITIRSNSSGGSLIAYGSAPLNWTSTSAGSYFVHFSPSSGCGDVNLCRTTAIKRLPAAAPMAYQSSSVTQASTLGAPLCGSNLEIIRILVNTTGVTSPINVTKLWIQTAGTDDPTNDISNIDIYYTGGNSTFSTTSLFGSEGAQPPTGDINIYGNQSLSTGANYFWVVYDLNITATIGHLLDATLRQITIDGTNNYNAPVSFNGDPSGSRPIVACSGSPGGVSLSNTYWLNGNPAYMNIQGGNRVSNWTSPLLGGITLNQTNYDQMGIYKESLPTFNYNSHVKFNGVFGSMEYTLAQDPLGNTGTVIMVCSPETSMNTALAYKSYSNVRYKIKPNLNCGYSNATNWQSNWLNAGAVATPKSRPQIFGMVGDISANSLNNGVYSTSSSNTQGKTVSGHLSLCSNDGSSEYSDNGIAEVIFYNRSLTTNELDKIQSYLAIKYGITLGLNGTSKNYVAPDGSTIWNVSQNPGFNYDIAGIGRDDIGSFEQKKSHSINGTTSTYSDILTIANGTNFNSPSTFSNNSSYFIWGRNNLPAQGDYLFDVVDPIKIRLMRAWKAQESGNVGTVTLEFDMSDVPGNNSPIPNDLNEVRLLINTGNFFGSGTTVISPSFVDNANQKVQFQHDFNTTTGFFFTIGSVNMAVAPLPVSLSEYTADCNNGNVDLAWTTQSETNNAYFAIEKSRDALSFDEVGRVNGHGTSTSLNQYSWTDDSKASGVAYYRLKQTDFDGAFEYHDIISIDCQDDYPFLIYPNPTNDGVFIQNFNPAKSKLEIQVYNVLGEIIDKREVTESTWLKLPDTQGIYFIKVRDGEKLFIEKIVKN